MPFNGTGTFVRVYQWVQDAANSIFVDATRTDTDTNDIADGLTNCVTRDGQSPWLADVPGGGFKLTDIAPGTVSGDAIEYDQFQAIFDNATFTGLTTVDDLDVGGDIDITGNMVASSGVNLTGAVVTVATQTAGDNTTKAASTAFVTATAFSAALPSQTGNSGKFVTTDGSNASWAYYTAASQAQMEAATDNTVMVTPAAAQYHPGVAKFWVKGDYAGAIAASHNVTSITDDGTGLVTVTIATDFSSANWSANTTALYTAGSGFYCSLKAQAAGSCQIFTGGPAAAGDADAFYVTGFGDQ